MAPAGARSAEPALRGLPRRCAPARRGELAGLHLWKGSSAKNREVTLVFLSRSPDRKHGSLRFVRKRGESEWRPPERGARMEPALFGLTLHAPLSALPSRTPAGRRLAPGHHAGSLLTGSSLSAPNAGQLRAPAFPTPSRTAPSRAVPVLLRRKPQQTPSAAAPRHQRPSAPATTAPSTATDPPLLTGGCAPRGGAGHGYPGPTLPSLLLAARCEFTL